MTATIIPYPCGRRWRFIVAQAEYAATMQPDAADRWITGQMKAQRRWMVRAQIDGHLVDREIRRLESAIRTAHRRRIEQTSTRPA